MIEIIEGEAADVLPSLAEKAHLIYLDSCFDTGRDFFMQKGPPVLAFSDRWPSHAAFRAYLRSLIFAAREALCDEGSLVAHCDSTFSHLVRTLCDEAFGPENYCDEIAWCYRRWPTKSRRTQRFHDTLIRYAVDPARARFNVLYKPLAASTLKQWGTGKQRAVMVDGARTRSSTGEEESPGVPMSDVWTDIPRIAPRALERVGFPTQKPQALLERVISTFSNEGDLVIDPTMGAATSLLAAHKLRRRVIGIDRSPVAIATARARLAAAGLV